MAISFDSVPNTLVPGTYVEFDPSGAAGQAKFKPQQVLIIGEDDGTGTLAARTPTAVASEQEVVTYAGPRSIARGIARYYFLNKHPPQTVLYLQDAPTGAASATGDITVSVTGTAAAGIIPLYIAGRRVQVGVAAADSAPTIAASIDAAISALTDIPVTSNVATGTPTVVDITAAWAGATGNEIDIRVNYNPGEDLPGGVGLTITPMSGGSGEPDFTGFWTNLGDEQYDLIICPYPTTTALGPLDTELEARWDPTRANDGRVVSCASDTRANLAALQSSHASKHTLIWGQYDQPNPPWEWAGALGGIMAFRAGLDPAGNLHGERIRGLLPPPPKSRWTYDDRNALLLAGISTIQYKPGGAPIIDRPVMTWDASTNAAYRDWNTPTTLSFLRWDFTNTWLTPYQGSKIVNDNTRFGAGQKIISRKIGRMVAMNAYRSWEERGLVEDFDGFKAGLIVERNLQDTARLDFQLPVNLANQLYVIGAKMRFLV